MFLMRLIDFKSSSSDWSTAQSTVKDLTFGSGTASILRAKLDMASRLIR